MPVFYLWHLWDLPDYSAQTNMGKYLEFILPVLAISLLTAGWMAVQLLAKKIGTKNHIDNDVSCCGDCEKKDTCDTFEKDKSFAKSLRKTNQYEY